MNAARNFPSADFASPRRKILVAVTGLSPQIVTETVYALWQEGGVAAVPNEVHILTTAEGAQRARLALLSDEPGWFHRLRQDYDMPPIDFTASNIHTLADADGSPLADIRSASDNALAADQISGFIRNLARDGQNALHVSIAGGRKTLGFFAGYALSLWGNTNDRLSHVLVSEPFESSWDFFYPTPYESIVQTRQGTIVDCATAVVTLADIPFVRLRHGMSAGQLDRHTTFAQAVSAAQGHLGPARLVLDLEGRKIEAAGTVVPLPPADLAFLAWFARRALDGRDAVAAPPDGVPSPEHAREYLDEYRRIHGRQFDPHSATVKRYRKGMSKADFEQGKSHLKRTLRHALEAAAAPYEIAGEGRRPMKYRLLLEPGAIRFAALPGDSR